MLVFTPVQGRNRTPDAIPAFEQPNTRARSMPTTPPTCRQCTLHDNMGPMQERDVGNTGSSRQPSCPARERDA